MLFGGLIARLEYVIREETAACAAARGPRAEQRRKLTRRAERPTERLTERPRLVHSICSLVSCSSPCLKLFTREAYV